MIVSATKRIEEAKDDSARLLYYNMLLRGLERFLDNHEASAEITYAEKESLRLAFSYSSDGRVSYLEDANTLPPNSAEYFNVAVGQFSEIPWLFAEQH